MPGVQSGGPRLKAMNQEVNTQIEALFQRCPALCGFSVRGEHEVPDSCARSADGSDLFVTDIGISPRLSPAQYSEIFQEIFSTLADLIAEQPGVGEELRGRTFARTLH
jgi:hypothetical protein